MQSAKTALIAAGLLLTGACAWAQTPAPAEAPLTNWWSKAPTTDAGMDGPVRLVWAAHKNPETL